MKFWQRVIIRLLYLTPIGYLLSIVSFLQGETIKGIAVDLKRYSPIRVNVKQYPKHAERFAWLVNSIFLFAEGWIVLTNQIAGTVGGAFALMAFLFGGVSVVSAIFPRFPWNKEIRI